MKLPELFRVRCKFPLHSRRHANWTAYCKFEVTSNFLKYSVAAIAVWNFLNMDDFEGDIKNLEQISCLCYNYLSSMCHLHNFRILRSLSWEWRKPGTCIKCRFETSCWRIAQCNMGCLAMFLLRKALHEVELSSTFRNGLQQLTTPLHSVSSLQQLVSQFYDGFNRDACARFLFFVPRNIAGQVAEKIAHCNRASTPNLGNLQRYIFNIARQVAEKIAQCNRALK